MKKDSLEDYLPFFKACTLTSKEILGIIKERPSEDVAVLAFKSGRVAPAEVLEIIRLIPDNSYNAYGVAMECNLTFEQKLEVIKAIPSLWRYVPAIRTIELGCNKAQILEVLNLIESQLDNVAPVAIRSGKLDKKSMFKILERVTKSVSPKNLSLATETAQAMIENDIINKDDIIAIMNAFPDVDYSRRAIAQTVFEQRAVDSSFIFSLLEICGKERWYAAIQAIKTKKLTPDEIVRAVRDFGESNWQVAVTAIENESLSGDQILKIFEFGAKKGLDKHQRNWVIVSLEKARLNGFILKQTFWGKWRINKI